jgi:hypothetical protein
MALGAVVASGAQAESAPFFSIGGTRLAAGKTHNITAHGIKSFELITAANGSNITCTKLSVEKGVLLGSEPGTQGKVDQTSKFEGCKLEAGNGAPNCHLAATEKGAESTTITTNPLSGELVENVESGKGGKKLEELYSPATGTQFVTIDFEGTGCEVFATKVTGKTAAEIVTDPGEASIELPAPTAENSSFITRFPNTAITEVWLVSGGTGKIVKVEQQAFANASVQKGTALINLANSTFQAETTKWSPLP